MSPLRSRWRLSDLLCLESASTLAGSASLLAEFNRRRCKGLTLIEVLVTLFLAGLAFALIFAMARAQSRVFRHQQEMERFLVDAEACMALLETDLNTAFAVSPTGVSSVIEVAHFMRNATVDQGKAPFNSEPFSPADLAMPVPADFRGTPLRTVYVLSDQRLSRISERFEPPHTGISDVPVLDGVNSATASVNGAMVDIRMTFLSQARAQTVQRILFVPGLVMP